MGILLCLEVGIRLYDFGIWLRGNLHDDLKIIPRSVVGWMADEMQCLAWMEDFLYFFCIIGHIWSYFIDDKI